MIVFGLSFKQTVVTYHERMVMRQANESIRIKAQQVEAVRKRRHLRRTDANE